MNYLKITIIAGEAEQELLIGLLSDFNPTGFEQLEDRLLAFFPEDECNQADVESVLKGYACTFEAVREQNWNEIWESNFPPVVVEDFCAIRAHFHQPVPGVPYEIVITPKMSFGTGHHATTYMMIWQMQRLSFAGKYVFDFGTGTGILAILAEKLGAEAVEAIDVDEWSITNAAENLERNGCRKINLHRSSQVPQKTFDIILANINKNVLLEWLPSMQKSLRPGGFLLLSGLLREDEPDMMVAIKVLKLRCAYRLERQNWLSMLLSGGEEA